MLKESGVAHAWRARGVLAAFGLPFAVIPFRPVGTDDSREFGVSARKAKKSEAAGSKGNAVGRFSRLGVNVDRA
jgi:hypothetical protein